MHARFFSPSALARVVACPGSAVLAADAEDRGSYHAAWGTVAHSLAADALSGRLDPADNLGQTIIIDGTWEVTIERDMLDLVHAYVEYVRGLRLDWQLVEQRVHFGRFAGIDLTGCDPLEASGTADLIGGVGDDIFVIDLKTGSGVPVAAEKNPQLLAYAAGALHLLDELGFAQPRKVHLVIFQPRVREEPSEWVVDADEVVRWARGELRATAELVLGLADGSVGDPQEHLFLGSHCRWCPVKAGCPEQRRAARRMAAVHEAGAVATATEEELAKMMDLVPVLEDWAREVRAETERRLLDGASVPGYKLVQGRRGPRKWADPTQAAEALRAAGLKPDQIYETEVKSPTAIERLVKAGALRSEAWLSLGGLIVQQDGAPSVAPADDPRPAIEVGISASEFN